MSRSHWTFALCVRRPRKVLRSACVPGNEGVLLLIVSVVPSVASNEGIYTLRLNKRLKFKPRNMQIFHKVVVLARWRVNLDSMWRRGAMFFENSDIC